ncbi:MAG: DUF6279 family lipoprotein, partial [Deltaproteobacteria bacterium]
YNNLNWLTRWRLDSYLDLTSEQDRWLNVQLAEHIAWHRKEELPQYVDFLRDIQKKARDGLTQEEWREGLEQVELGWQRILDRLRPDAAKLLADLDPDQVEELKSEFQEENEEIVERLAEPAAEREEKRRERRQESLEEWFGDWSPEQLQALEGIWQKSRSEVDETKSRLERRERSQAEFFNFLNQQPNQEQAEQWLIGWQRQLQGNDQQNDWRSRYEARVLAIDQILTAPQREHALAKLGEYIVEIEKLIAEK